MAKVKISEFSSNPALNTDIDSINIAEGCAPSGINDAIRELMAQLKDFQTGAQGDSFNGPVGTTTAAAGAFTTLSASSTLSVTGTGTIQGLTVGRGAGAVATNTAVGASALAANTSGDGNVAVGSGAGSGNTTGTLNTYVGKNSGVSNTTSSGNTGLGAAALNATTGANNTSVGTESMVSNSSGASNVAVGRSALYSNTTAGNNTAVGYQSAYSNTTGDYLTIMGRQAGYSNTTGKYNTFIGASAGYDITTGSYNTFIGSLNSANTRGAGTAMTTGSNNTIIGNYSGNYGGLDIRTASNYIVLSDGDGNPNLYLDNNQNIFVPRTYLNTTATAANMVVGSNGGYARSTSALKYKQDIRELESMDINSLRPVRYKSKCEGDDQTKDHFGLIADEAADAGFEELVTRGANGEVEGFQYERLTVVLLKKLQTLDAEFKAYVASHP